LEEFQSSLNQKVERLMVTYGRSGSENIFNIIAIIEIGRDPSGYSTD
jgi:hypothetical protein